jgi:hypothetical protein
MNETASCILIVEDDPSFTYLIQRYAEKSGLRMVNTPQGEDALALAQKAKPAAIMLDIALPGINGWEVLRILKGHPDTRDIPVVMCSGFEEEARSFEEGADGYLRKPVRYQDFLLAMAGVGLTTRL